MKNKFKSTNPFFQSHKLQFTHMYIYARLSIFPFKKKKKKFQFSISKILSRMSNMRLLPNIQYKNDLKDIFFKAHRDYIFITAQLEKKSVIALLNNFQVSDVSQRKVSELIDFRQSAREIKSYRISIVVPLRKDRAVSDECLRILLTWYTIEGDRAVSREARRAPEASKGTLTTLVAAKRLGRRHPATTYPTIQKTKQKTNVPRCSDARVSLLPPR